MCIIFTSSLYVPTKWFGFYPKLGWLGLSQPHWPNRVGWLHASWKFFVDMCRHHEKIKFLWFHAGENEQVVPFQTWHHSSRTLPAPSVLYHTLCRWALLPTCGWSNAAPSRRDSSGTCRTCCSMVSAKTTD